MKTKEMEKFENFYKEYVDYLKTFSGKDRKFKIARDEEKFEKISLNLPWGVRNCLRQKEDDGNYKLQLSRGMSLSLDFTPEEAYNHITFLIDEIIESDIIRINELDGIIKNKTNLKIENYKPENFFEIGFRIPRLQKLYKERGLGEAGCDINQFNVKSGNLLGFNCIEIDLTKKIEISDLKKSNLIVCYHVIEHLTDPLFFLKNLYDSTSNNTLFHFEIPVEPDGPHIARAHLFPFHEKDLLRMVEAAGFRPLTISNSTHTGGPVVERVSFFKD